MRFLMPAIVACFTIYLVRGTMVPGILDQVSWSRLVAAAT